ncbi:hypothetical protein NQ314_018174 [Rhamnusium bicolor]|uniref:C2H2-type domain-containing protein n=1 Tax=Rhamnusium bicolor TaxID=1586634 RepID=A0AAV8WT04_9CUCU|nr:hypothetical protein NQ314_018174 [Rhamnusium bicolor]
MSNEKNYEYSPKRACKAKRPFKVKQKAVIKKHSLLYEMKKPGKTGDIQIETGKTPANSKAMSYDDTELIQHSNVKGRQRQMVIENINCARKALPKRKGESNINKIKSSDQSKEIKENFVQNNDAEKLEKEIDHINKCLTRDCKEQLDKDNTQGENAKSCHYDNMNKIVMENSQEETNLKKTIARSQLEKKKIQIRRRSLRNISVEVDKSERADTKKNEKIRTEIENRATEYCKKFMDASSQTKIDELLDICTKNANEQNTDYLCTTCSFKTKRKAILKQRLPGLEFSTTTEEASIIDPKDKIAGESTYDNEKIDNENNPLEEKCSYESDLSNKDINIEYNCIKCLFKTKRRATLKKHLLTHGTELSTGIITFLDLVKNERASTNQFDQYGEDKVQTQGSNYKAKNKIETLQNTAQNHASFEKEQNFENKYENSCENYPTDENMDKNIEVIHSDEENNSNVETVIIKNEEEVALSINHDPSATNLDNKSDNPITDGTKTVKLEVESENMYYCDKCSYQTDRKKNFKSHKIEHSKNVFKCNLCDFITNLQRNLNGHMLTHLKPNEIKMLKCPHCPYQAKRSNALGNHMVLHNKPEVIRMFQCDECPYQAKRKNNLKVHQLRHKSTDKLTPFNCDVCSYKARDKSALRKHIIVHKKVEETVWYKCDQCSYSTKYKSWLTRHSVVHKKSNEIKTYDCTECSYKAKHKGHLNSHMLLHQKPNQVKVYHCDHCSYKSIQKTKLFAHQMLQHKKNMEISMVKCSQCPFETKLKSNLLKHINRIHISK